MNEANRRAKNTINMNAFERHPKPTLFVIVVFGIILVIFGLEGYLSWKNKYRERPGVVRYIRLRENPPKTIYPIVPNEYYMNMAKSFDPQKHRLCIDEEGFIYPSRIHEQPDISIVFLGGSTTECLYVEEDKRFPFLVGRFLEKNVYKVNAYNGGVAGNDSLHSLNILINKVFPLHPNFVVIMHNINDLSILLHEKTYWHDISTRSMIIKETPKLALGSAVRQVKNMLIPNLYIKIRDFINMLRVKFGLEKLEFERLPGVKAIDERLIVETFRRNLQMMVDLCRVQNITPVLMTEPSRLVERPDEVVKGGAGNLPPMTDTEYFQIRNLFNLFNQAIRDVGKKNGVLVIDLAMRIPQEQQYIYDVIHFTDKGSLLAAKMIAGEIEKVLKNGKVETMRGK